MAAQMAAIKARRAKGIALPEDMIENKLSVLPVQKDRLFEIELGMLMLNGLWQTRRVIWSKDVMTFSRIGEDTVFDSIPLTEIKSVEKIDESVIAGSSFHHRNSFAKSRTNDMKSDSTEADAVSTSSTPDDMMELAPEKKPAPEKEPDEEKRTRVVEVRVLSAQNLPRMDAFGKCDAFCRLTFCGEPRETSVQRNTLCPEWDKAFVFDLGGRRATDLTLELLDWDLVGDSDLVGRTVVPEQAMAEAADSPVGWSRQLSCVLQDPLKNEKNIVGENHQESVVQLRISVLAEALDPDGGEEQNVLQVQTTDDGYNSGRTYYFRATSDAQCSAIVDSLSRNALIAREKAEKKSRLRKIQASILCAYESTPFQSFVALLIMANFITTIASSQLNRFTDGETTNEGVTTVENLDLFFTAIFTAELIFNILAHWFLPFVTNAWHMFDFVIVLLALVALGPINIPVKALRVLRAFRVLRLFGRLKSLRNIVAAISASIVPVLNAFVIIYLVASIYAIMGVNFFGDIAPDDFGSYDLAFITIFTMTAGNSWIGSIPRIGGNGELNYSFALYIISYFVVVNWSLLQVTVAILLNSFVGAIAATEEEANQAAYASLKSRDLMRNTLDPLLRKLSLDFIDVHDLSQRIAALFQSLDSEQMGSISFPDLCRAFKKLGFSPCIHLTESDYSSFTQDGELCSQDGRLNSAQFEAAMRNQLHQYSGRRISDFLYHGRGGEAEHAQLQTLKLIMSATICSDQRIIKVEKSIHDMSRSLESILQLLQTQAPRINPQVSNGALAEAPKCLQTESVTSEDLNASVVPLSHPSLLPLQGKQIPQLPLSTIFTQETQPTSTQASHHKANSSPFPLHIAPSPLEQASMNAALLQANSVQPTSPLDLPASSEANGIRKVLLEDVVSLADQLQSTFTLLTQLKTNLAPPASHITSSIPEHAITAQQQTYPQAVQLNPTPKKCAAATVTSVLDVRSGFVAGGARKDLVGYAAPSADPGNWTPIDPTVYSDSKGIRALVEGETSEKVQQRLGRRPVKVILDTAQQGAVSPSLSTSGDYLQHQDIGGPKDAALDGGCSGYNTLNKRAQYLSSLATLDVTEDAAESQLSENLKGRWSGRFRRSNTICITPAQGSIVHLVHSP